MQSCYPQRRTLTNRASAAAAINLFRILLNALTFRSTINRFPPLSRQFVTVLRLECTNKVSAHIATSIDPTPCKSATLFPHWRVLRTFWNAWRQVEFDSFLFLDENPIFVSFCARYFICCTVSMDRSCPQECKVISKIEEYYPRYISCD